MHVAIQNVIREKDLTGLDVGVTMWRAIIGLIGTKILRRNFLKTQRTNGHPEVRASSSALSKIRGMMYITNSIQLLMALLNNGKMIFPVVI